jgi:hypothetical protein
MSGLASEVWVSVLKRVSWRVVCGLVLRNEWVSECVVGWCCEISGLASVVWISVVK